MKHFFTNLSIFKTGQLHRLFPACALLTGLLYIAVTPPFQVPDEYMHFGRSLTLAKGNIFVVKDKDKMGYSIDCSAAELMRTLPRAVEFKTAAKYPWNDFWRINTDSQKLSGECFWEIDRGNLHMHVPYLYAPQVLGITLAKFFSPSPAVWLYSGRIFNLLVCVVVLSMALNLYAGSKLRLVFFFTLPMFFHLLGSLSGDALTITLTFLFFSLITRFLFEGPRPSRRDWWTIAMVAILVGSSKSVYFPLLMLIFLIPIQSRKKSDWISGGVIFVVSFSLLIIWNWVVRDDYYSTQVYGMDPRLQFHWFADHPISGIKAVAGGLVVNAHQIAVTYFGLFGWLSIIMPLPWYLLYFLLTIMIFLFEPEKVLMDNTLIRPAMALLPLGVMLLFSLVMYITFTKVGAPFATGFQGRHFMPLMPFLFLGVFHGKNSSRFREKIPSAALLAIIVLNLWAVAAIYCGFN